MKINLKNYPGIGNLKKQLKAEESDNTQNFTKNIYNTENRAQNGLRNDSAFLQIMNFSSNP